MIRPVTYAVLAGLFGSASLHCSAAEGVLAGANMGAIAPEVVKQGSSSATEMVNGMLKAYEARSEADFQSAAQLSRRADDIANEVLAKGRSELLNFLGIDPEGSTSLYYFVSWSMPLEMLRAYAVDAMWAGGTLVFKGVPPGRDLGEFLTQDLQSLVYGKGAAASISLDPRLFDAYQVGNVPAIVFTTVRANMQCQGVEAVPVKLEGQEGSYDKCPPLTPDAYWKVSGAVSTAYALNAFKDVGAVKVQPHLDALARGLAVGASPEKVQKPYAGEWKNALSPSEQLAVQKAAEAMGVPPEAKKAAP